MKTKLVSILLLILFAFEHCSKKDDSPKTTDPEIVGTWEKVGYISKILENNKIEVAHSTESKESQMTIDFKADGSFLKKKVSLKNALLESSDGKWRTEVDANRKIYLAEHKSKNGLIEGVCYNPNSDDYSERYSKYDSQYLIIVTNIPACDGLVSVYQKK